MADVGNDIIFSARETSVLLELLKGSTDKETAYTLGMTVPMVKVTMHAMRRRVGGNRVQLALWAERSGLFK